MRSFKTFLAEVNLGQIADLKPSSQSRKGRLAPKPPSLRRQADDPRQQLSRERQLELGINLPSGEAKPAPGPELLAGGIATAPARAALRGAASLAGKGAKFVRDQPYKFLNRKLGINRLRQKMPGATKLILPGTRTGTGAAVVGTGYGGVYQRVGRDVGEYVSQTYPEDIKVGSLEAQREFFKLPLADQMALATSKPALRDYLGPLAMGTGAVIATGNPLAAAVVATPPGIAARRAISGIGTTLGGAEDIQYGENPAAQDAARRYMERITALADKKLETKKAETARQQGMRQALPDPKYGRYKSWWDKRHEKPKEVEVDMSLFED
jgi:hypothetical protein